MKKLIIVCEEKFRHYGDFLAQLISNTDDTEDSIVGIKDGVAAAQVWTEKEYASNAPQISSEQYILFIGNSKLIKEKRAHMLTKYSEYGMNYGWLGKQGVLFVDHIVSYSEYEEFYKLACKGALETRQSEVPKLIESKDHTNEIGTDGSLVDAEPVEDGNEAENGAEVEPETIEPAKENKLQKFLSPFGKEAKNLGKGTVNFLRKATDSGTKRLDNFANNMTVASKSKEIENQEYTCLVLMFYLKDLGNFLGLGE